MTTIKVPAIKIPAIVRDFSAIDATETELKLMHKTRNDQHKKLATTILMRKDKALKKADILEECDRLIDVAKGIVKDSGYKIKNTHEMKNCWTAVKNIIRQRLTVAISPDTVITCVAGKDERGNVVTAKVKVSELPETARALATNAKELTATLNPDSTDKRRKNGKKRTPRTPDSGTAPQTHSSSTTAKGWSTAIDMMFKAGIKAQDEFYRALKDNLPKIQEIAHRKGEVISINPKLKK